MDGRADDAGAIGVWQGVRIEKCVHSGFRNFVGRLVYAAISGPFHKIGKVFGVGRVLFNVTVGDHALVGRRDNLGIVVARLYCANVHAKPVHFFCKSIGERFHRMFAHAVLAEKAA